MKRLLPVLVLLALCLGVACADGTSSPRFVPLDIYIDSPAALAAWQFELKDRNGAMKVVGVESGGHAGFPRAPYYDREAVARMAALQESWWPITPWPTRACCLLAACISPRCT